MRVRFEPVTAKVKYDCQSGSPSNEFEIIISTDGSKAELGKRDSRFGRAPSEIGKEILDHALKVFPY